MRASGFVRVAGFRALRSDALAPLRTTALENETAAAGAHPLAEAMLFFAFAEARLKCAFRHVDNPCMIRMKMMAPRARARHYVQNFNLDRSRRLYSKKGAA